MKTLHVVALLCSAALLCDTAPTALLPVTCSEDGMAAAAHFAMHRINENHHHGYKFRLGEIKGNKIDKVDDGCNIELELDLNETKCATVNPKHFEDCETRSESSRAVVANCTIMMSVNATGTAVNKYKCDTRQEKTNQEMVRDCPDCPILISLRDPQGLTSIREAVASFNKNTSNEHLYILHEVGRISSSYMFMAGMGYFAEFLVVETGCPRESRIAIRACRPLCADKARFAFCRSSYTSNNGLSSVDCEFYPPVDTAPEKPDDILMCRRSFGLGPPNPGLTVEATPSTDGGPPHKDRGPPHKGHGPPHKGHGPPHKGHGPPPGLAPPAPPIGADRSPHGPPGHREGAHPFLTLHPCHSIMASSDTAIHPICPFPFHGGPGQRPSES
ncbi:alpha-2-HS-glycoprotein glycoprotein-like [Solea senegalensis]|uniref:Alpha-2-HS-glycoprotein glycoprotein-like n=1 Tax=Solea senegalensis TaxID=28829 RepID=A0AAV6SB34_SOLSE|nr:alpha-2-HS-glycoprotein 1 [Solea senegalensis]KAG7514035.1 alpha-2-HS-glycoprotein glycoprotein-like [Solea senegalensis]